jgi:4-aminobutyrate aminotransferase/(S)-3-amino-2-methylpropionate transaminase
VPGPKSKALAERRQKAVAPGVSSAHPIFIERGHGATVTDVDGNTYLDFTSGLGVLNIGYTHPDVVRAISDEAARLTHTCFQVTQYEGYVAVAEALCRLLPGSFEKRAFLASTGAEAVENAVKIARAHTKRQAVLCFEHAFHGRTLLGMTLTGKTSPYKIGFGPFAPEIYRLPFPYAFRERMPYRLGALNELEAVLQTLVRPADLAAIIIEPVLGEGGFLPAPRELLADLRALADRYGIVLIADEVQSGFGRTGKMFACEHLGVVPDLMTMAKSLAGGLPLSAVVGRASVIDSVPGGGLGGTYAGNPIACAAALATIRVLEEWVRSGQAQSLGSAISDRLHKLSSPLIGEVRGIGAMQAVELVKDARSKEPASQEVAQIIAMARSRGLLLLAAGTYSNVIRFLIPLGISNAELDEGLTIFEEALAAVSAQR